MHGPSIVFTLAISAIAGFGVTNAAMKPLAEPKVISREMESCEGYIALATRLGSAALAASLQDNWCGMRAAERPAPVSGAVMRGLDLAR